MIKKMVHYRVKADEVGPAGSLDDWEVLSE